MSLKYGLLGLINNMKTTGYEINKKFKHSLDYFWVASTSQIYREITGLVSEGLVSEKLVYQSDKPNKKILTITDKGKEELMNWLMDYESIIKINDTRNPMMLRMFFLYNLSIDDAIGYVKCCQNVFQNNLLKMEAGQKLVDLSPTPNHKVFYQLTVDYGRMQMEAAYQWSINALKTLENEKAKQVK